MISCFPARAFHLMTSNMNFTKKNWLRDRWRYCTADWPQLTAWSEVSPVRHGDGNHSQDKAEDPHENQGSTKCCLPLSTAGAALTRPRGSWSAHPGGGRSDGGGGGGGGVPHCHILLSLTSTQLSLLSRTDLKTPI